MFRIRCLVCLALLASTGALAQTRATPLSQAAPAPSCPPLLPAREQPHEPAPHEDGTPREDVPRSEPVTRFSPGRVALASVGGFAAGYGLLFVGDAVFGDGASCGENDRDCLFKGLLLTLPIYSTGLALGVHTVGRFMNGQGRFLPTLVGAVAGSGAGMLLFFSGNVAAGLLGVLLLPIPGAVIGYELSQREPGLNPGDSEGQDDEEDAYARAGVRLTPLLGVTPRGGLFGGISGRF